MSRPRLRLFVLLLIGCLAVLGYGISLGLRARWAEERRLREEERLLERVRREEDATAIPEILARDDPDLLRRTSEALSWRVLDDLQPEQLRDLGQMLGDDLPLDEFLRLLRGDLAPGTLRARREVLVNLLDDLDPEEAVEEIPFIPPDVLDRLGSPALPFLLATRRLPAGDALGGLPVSLLPFLDEHDPDRNRTWAIVREDPVAYRAILLKDRLLRTTVDRTAFLETLAALLDSTTVEYTSRWSMTLPDGTRGWDEVAVRTCDLAAMAMTRLAGLPGPRSRLDLDTTETRDRALDRVRSWWEREGPDPDLPPRGWVILRVSGLNRVAPSPEARESYGIRAVVRALDGEGLAPPRTGHTRDDTLRLVLPPLPPGEAELHVRATEEEAFLARRPLRVRPDETVVVEMDLASEGTPDEDG